MRPVQVFSCSLLSKPYPEADPGKKIRSLLYAKARLEGKWMRPTTESKGIKRGMGYWAENFYFFLV